MKSLRIKLSLSKDKSLEKCVKKFNSISSYWDEIKVISYTNHKVLLLPVAEASIFVRSCLEDLPKEAQEKLRQEVQKALQDYLVENPQNIPAKHSLGVIQQLSF